MSVSQDFTCPACGAEFEVQERVVERQEEPQAEDSAHPPAEGRTGAPVSFQCAACGADFDTRQSLEDTAEARR